MLSVNTVTKNQIIILINDSIGSKSFEVCYIFPFKRLSFFGLYKPNHIGTLLCQLQHRRRDDLLYYQMWEIKILCKRCINYTRQINWGKTYGKI